LLQRLSADNVNGYISVAAVPDGHVLATASDKTVRMWNAASEKEIGRFDLNQDGRAITVTPDGKRFVVACGDKTVRLWDIAGKSEVRRTSADPVVWRLTLSPDSKSVAFGVGNGVMLWNLDSGETRHLKSSSKNFDGIAFSRDGRFVLGGSVDRHLHVWEMDSGRVVGRVSTQANVIRSVTVSPDGSRAATSSTDGTGAVWQLPDTFRR
jgi:WD40 repeat protein